MVLLQENENLLEFLDSNENEFRDETEIETVRADLTRIRTKLEELLKGGRQEGQVRLFARIWKKFDIFWSKDICPTDIWSTEY